MTNGLYKLAELMDSLYGCPAGSSWEGFFVADIEHLNDIAGPRRKNLCQKYVALGMNLVLLLPRIFMN